MITSYNDIMIAMILHLNMNLLAQNIEIIKLLINN
jgi:hypothetical protein